MVRLIRCLIFFGCCGVRSSSFVTHKPRYGDKKRSAYPNTLNNYPQLCASQQ